MKRWMVILLVMGLFLAAPESYTQAAPAVVSELVTLTPDLPSGQPVGTIVTWTVMEDIPDPVDFAFRYGRVGEPLHMMVDFSDKYVFPWAPLGDGDYVVEARVRNRVTGEITTVTAPFALTARATIAPVVSPVENPIMALYSAPPCPMAYTMRVFFREVSKPRIMVTDAKACTETHSMNFYIAGMKANANYALVHELLKNGVEPVAYGPLRTFTTGSLPFAFPAVEVQDAPDAQTSLYEGVLLVGPGVRFGTPPELRLQYAMDLGGNVIWYDSVDHELFPTLNRILPGGNRLYEMYGERRGYVLRESDLAGNIVHETTIRRINEQLAQMGYWPVTSFHHDAIRLPNGDTAVIANTERILVDVQRPGPVDVLGDYILVLDADWQLKWAWDPFAHLDPARVAVLDERCFNESPGCPPLLMAPMANDWMHSNSLSYSPTDGNLILSMRHQDWLIKIDYADGAGSGDVLWRMGPEGDFTVISDDPDPWFTHQHDANLIGAATDHIVLYDNGNTRCQGSIGTCSSRGQVWSFDEANMTATLLTNTYLGHYSNAFGSAQLLANGNYHFGSGIVIRPQPPIFFSYAVEALADGSINYQLQMDYASYRSYRLPDLYTPSDAGAAPEISDAINWFNLGK